MNNYQLSRFFSTSYLEAKTRLISAAKKKGLYVRSYDLNMKGLQGEDLSMDTVEIGNRNCKNVLIILSGTHGIEGFSGSACQLSLLDRLDTLELDKQFILLVHALNPFGFSFLRRTNESNIDVNRNFLDFDKEVHSNDEPEHSLIGKLRKTSNGVGKLALSLTLLTEIVRGNKVKVQKLITEGQYVHEKDLFFGGFSSSKSALIWQDLVAKYQDKEVYLLDIHSGLGMFGEGYVISHAKKDSVSFRNNNQYFDGLNLVHTSTDLSVSSTLNGNLSSSIPNPDNALVLEFGTYSGLKVLNAMAVENYHYWENKNSIKYVKSRTQLKNTFTPNSKKWKHQIVETFLTVLEKQKALMAISQ
ncbi:MAG: hypothetical protein ACI9D5_001963 [Candidatus Endobugula sp.]|jgi:hypothetical protein